MTTLSWIIALVLATLGGISLVLLGLSKFLHALAPHTKTKWDDNAAADVDALRGRVDQLEQLVTKLLPANIAVAKKPEAGFTTLGLLGAIALAALVTVASCLSTVQKGALHDTATCAETAGVKDLTEAAKEILASGIASWRQVLDGLGKAYGQDAVLCAVANAQQFFASKVGGADPAAADAQRRASTYLAEHGAR